MKRNVVFMLFLFVILSFITGCAEKNNEIIQDPDKNPEIDSPEDINPQDCIKGAILDSIIDGTTTVVFSNGVAINLADDSIFGHRIVIDSLDFEKEQWTEDKSVVIYCDSAFVPALAYTKSEIYAFSKKSEREFDVVVTDLNGNYLSSVKDVEVNGPIFSRASTALDNITKTEVCISITNALIHAIKKDPSFIIDIGSLAFISLGDDIDGIFLDAFATKIAATLSGRIFGSVIFTVDVIKAAAQKYTWYCIGDCTPKILQAQQILQHEVEVNINFSKVSSDSRKAPFYRAVYWYVSDNPLNQKKYYSTPVLLQKNGDIILNIDNIDRMGRIGMQILVFPDVFYNNGLGFINNELLQEFYGYRSNIIYLDIKPMASFSVQQKSIEHIKNKFNVKYSAELKFEDEKDKQYYKDFGVRFVCGSHEYMHSIKTSGTNGKIEFVVQLDKKEFNLDYNEFKALHPYKAEISAYYSSTSDLFFRDKNELPIVYEEKPFVSTGEVIFIDQTSAIISCYYKNVILWTNDFGMECSSENQTITKTLNAENDGTFNVELVDLKPNTKYKCRAYFIINNQKRYSDNITSFTTSERGGISLCPDDNHPHMIDLGLPSGVKWACCNVGASSPENFGGYYSWGETEEKKEYTYESYQYAIYNPGIKDGIYSLYDFIDIGTNINGTGYDVAHVKWGAGWQMPTDVEIKELFEDPLGILESSRTVYNGVTGVIVTSNNGNSIFFPYAGHKFDDEDDYVVHTEYSSGRKGYHLILTEKGLAWGSRGGDGFRIYGFPVRPVYKR